MKKRLFAVLASLCMVVSMVPTMAFAQDSGTTIGVSDLCEHHTEHTSDCGYTEGTPEQPCAHEHTDECYAIAGQCVHTAHDESCGGLADPTACTHVCGEDTGCVIKTLNCQHQHDESCGYVPAAEGTPCGFVCEACQGAIEQEHCSCSTLCTEGAANPGCPVCSAEGADLAAACKGTTPSVPAACICATLCTGEEINADCPVCSAEGAELDKVCVGVAPVLLKTTFAAGNGKAIQLGTSALSENVNTDNAATIYFGKDNNDNPGAWRAIGYGGNGVASAQGDMTLLAASNMGVAKFDSDGVSNEYATSDLKTAIDTLAEKLTTEENAAVNERTLISGSYSGVNTDCVAGAQVDNAVFWPLSTAEASVVNNDLRAAEENPSWASSWWWLRSPGYNDNIAAVVAGGGSVQENQYAVSTEYGVRPAFHLDLNSVLFTSAAEGGKSSGDVGAGAMKEVSAYSGNEWKLTLLDNSRNFSISNTAINSNGDTVGFSYTDAKTGENEYISVVIEENGAITYYGRILQLDGSTNGASGTASLMLPTGVTLSNTTKLYVFNEQYNGGGNDDSKLTDYGSQMIEVVNSTVDDTAPTLSNGSATRDSETTAIVKFTSTETGKYYYAVVESGAAEPTIDPTGTGTFCDTAEQNIFLDNLSGTGAKDIYIVAKDAVGNVSDKLKIEIPAYVAPSYSISVFPATLDFGSVTEGYTTAPDAKAVTITNTGNQSVTVGLPTSTNYTITAGTGFENSAATVEPNDTATFTVQPNTGLGVGTYDETLTISGSNSTKASVELSFEVLDTYTLTVNLNGGSGSTTGGKYPAGEVINIDAGSRSNYRFNGWTSSNGGTFADASSAQTTFTMPDNDVTVTASWKKNSGGGGGGSSYRDREYEFWMDVKEQIRDADPGDTIKVNARSYDRMPWSVMEALREAEDVTLRITWNGGGDIIIPSAAALNKDNGRIYYPLSYLEGLEFAQPAEQTGAGQTGSTVEVEAPASNPAGWEPTAPTEGQTQEQPESEPEESASQPESKPASEPETEPETAPEAQPDEETMARPESGGLPLALILGGGAAVIAAGLGFWLWKRRSQE